MTHGIEILFVDDNEDIRSLVRDTGLMLDLRVKAFRDPAKALEELRNHAGKYCAVVSDYRIGFEMTGLHFLERAKQICGGRAAYVLYTGETHEKLQELAKEVGVHYVFKEPGKTRDFLKSLGETG